MANKSWIKTTTLADAVDNVPPNGKIYLPDSSYREMTEWAPPTAELLEYDGMRRDMEHDTRWPILSQFVRGGFWRNFKVKYPEADEMYTRMLMISRRVEEAEQKRHDRALVDAAQSELYRGQCNCSYWHGGSADLFASPAKAVYRSLIAADNLLDRAADRQEPWIEAVVGDFDLDARQEVFLANDKLASLDPSLAWRLDVRAGRPHRFVTIYWQRWLASPRRTTVKCWPARTAMPTAWAAFTIAWSSSSRDLQNRLQYDDLPREKPDRSFL